jgi:hypothetical protein
MGAQPKLKKKCCGKLKKKGSCCSRCPLAVSLGLHSPGKKKCAACPVDKKSKKGAKKSKSNGKTKSAAKMKKK